MSFIFGLIIFSLCWSMIIHFFKEDMENDILSETKGDYCPVCTNRHFGEMCLP